MTRTGLAAIGLGVMLAAGPALADSGSGRLLDVLMEKGILTEREAEEIRKEASEPRESALRTPVEADVQYDPVEPFIDDQPAIRVRRLAIDS
ncbi:MAG: hypothetical protein JJT85_09070, partial [Chromatiales bacterium]|nr:hypothetical protein [Chromatiales bacterium]